MQNESQFDEIHEAFKNKKPIIIVSGHIGPWEAVRAILKRKGIETAAIYRQSKNLFYEPYHLKVISEGGKPVFQSGRKETKDIVKYLRKGGVLCVMIDQSISNGKYINFLGHPAKTSMVIQKLHLM